jgi:excinuclease UvrABC nuclease subunit
MEKAARDLDFMEAARLRDQLVFNAKTVGRHEKIKPCS